MEKITIKPTSKELVYRNNDPNIYFDAFSYEGAGAKEKSLGSLYVIGQVKYGDEDLAYLINLISSLAKREYYSGFSDGEIQPKTSFESTLKKLNEVLEDFFRNKEFKLAVGLAAVSGENIYIARLGNVRFGLAREDNFIDVLSNIGLFSQEHIEEKEFSNIVSGKLKVGDKLFMYLPSRSVIAREKPLRELLKKEAQLAFSDKIESLSKTANNFACCGIHVEIGNLREIAVDTRPSYYAATASTKTESAPKIVAAVAENSESAVIEHEPSITAPAPTPEPLKPHIIPADVSLNRRKTTISLISSLFSKKSNRSRNLFLPRSSQNQKPLLIAGGVGILILIVGGYFLFFSGSGNATISQAKASIQTIKDDIGRNDYRAARILIHASLGLISTDSGSKANDVRADLLSLLSSTDKLSDQKPTVFWDGSKNSTKLGKIIASEDGIVYGIDTQGKVFAITSEKENQTGDIQLPNAQFTYNIDGKIAAIEAGTGNLNSFDKKSGKTASYSLKGFENIKSGAIYQGNLYALTNDGVVKYVDVALGESNQASWAKGIDGTSQSIAADGNIYILSNTGKIATYYKGSKSSESDLNLTPNSTATIFTSKDLPFVYLTDKTTKEIMIFDKTNGSLKQSHILTDPSQVIDISIAKDQSIYILSADNKILLIR